MAQVNLDQLTPEYVAAWDRSSHPYALGGTRYSYEEIRAAAEDVNAADAELRMAMEEASSAWERFREGHQWGKINAIGWECFLEGDDATFRDLFTDERARGANVSAAPSEEFPVGKWRREAARCRVHTKRVRKVLNQRAVTA